MSDFTETIRRSTQRAARERLLSPEMVQTGRAIRPGGGGDWPIPISPAIHFISTTSRRLVRETHMGHWLYFRNVGDPPSETSGAHFDIILPPNPVPGVDWYYMTCHGNAPYYVHIFSSDQVDQIITMPTLEWTGPHKYIDLCCDNHGGAPAGMLMLILACVAANHWVCVDATTSFVDVGEIP